MPVLRIARAGFQRVRPYAGRFAHNVKTNPRWALATGVGAGLGAGYLAGRLSQPDEEVYEEKRKDGTLIRKIFKKDDGSVNVLGIILLICIIAGIYMYFKKRKEE